MSSFASELAKALNRPHGPVKALMWFTIAFGGSYVYMEHIKPLQDAAAWEQMKKDIKTSGDGWLPHYEARNPNDIATEYERTYGVERQLTTDFTWEQLEGAPSKDGNDLRYAVEGKRLQAAFSR